VQHEGGAHRRRKRGDGTIEINTKRRVNTAGDGADERIKLRDRKLVHAAAQLGTEVRQMYIHRNSVQPRFHARVATETVKSTPRLYECSLQMFRSEFFIGGEPTQQGKDTWGVSFVQHGERALVTACRRRDQRRVVGHG